MFDKDKIVYQSEGAVLKAWVAGFYKIKGLAAKSGRCRHVSCGATKPSTCYYWSAKKDHEQKMATGIAYSYNGKNEPYTAAQQAYAVAQLNTYKTIHTKCAEDWCERAAGRPRPDNLGEMVTCTRHHLQPYTQEELADPNVKPESIAIEMTIAFRESRNNDFHFAIGLYDLVDDKWFNDGWWTGCGYKSENIMPHANNKEFPAPKTLVNISQVIDAVKAKL